MKPEDKAALWERIQHGFNERPRVFRIGWKVAAAVVVLVAAGWWLLQQRQPENALLAFAKTQVVTDSLTETRLVLSNNKSVTLSDTSASLTYSGNGTRVSVNNQEQYEQEGQAGIQYNTLIVPYGRRARVQLQDGTVVWLNAGSRLIYPMAFSDKNREVFLEGEGYFDVKQQAEQPFFVYTRHLKTAVLGTQFNVNAYADEEQEAVVLVSGSVQVKTNKGNNNQLLTPGNMAAYGIATQHMYKEKVNTTAYTAWKDGRLVFEQTRLDHILKKLSRYFNVSITAQTQQVSTFSGDLDLSENMEDVLEAVSISTGLTFKKAGPGYVFKD